MSELPEWRLDYLEYTSSVTGDTLRKPIMTNGQCRVITLSRPGPFAEMRIRTVEFVLSNWPHWKALSGFQSVEIVR